jgi:hypothetical protein
MKKPEENHVALSLSSLYSIFLYKVSILCTESAINNLMEKMEKKRG